MSLEQYKTQVLLLHSQQSTLDSLSTGFNERYTVHCATSGTEALNTLVETPIHVIVSAQDLPGMSGLDALREARKRSPDTIGILLAGTDKEDGLEALVGDQEVFQIVRGEIAPDALRELIDNATKRVRLMALSESANDQAANVDEPVAEHIIMETSENGSPIISDGTGTMPALKPQKIQVAPDAGGRGVDVLVLTKDEEFLVTIKDSSRGMHNVHHASTPTQAEAIAKNHKVGILVTDAAMVGSNIEILTQRLRAEVPRLVAVVAGRRDDGEMLMDLINRGQVYRFLLKPVSPGRARLAIEASVRHHLEAADSAFKQAPAKAAAARPAPKSAAKRVPKPVLKQAPRQAPKQAPRQAPRQAPKAAPQISAKPPPKAKPKSRAAAAAIKPRKAPTISEMPPDDGLDDPFATGGGFTETMTGIVASVGKSISDATESLKGDAKRAEVAPSPGAPGAGVAILRNPKLLGAAASVILAAGATWFFIGSTDPDGSEDVAAGSSATSPSVVESDLDPASLGQLEAAARRSVADLLEEARLARDSGQIISPRGGSAIELYVAVRDAAPDDVIIAAEFDEVVNQVFGLAESALLEQRIDDATAAIALARFATPDNPRLTFLDAQLQQMQLRQALDGARVAIRENRFEDAAVLLRRAESVADGDMTNIELLADELAAARSEQRVEDVLGLAAQRLDEDRLTSPSNDNARYYFELALSNDPENAAARQGLVLVAGKLVLGAREAIDTGRFDDAERLLSDSRALDPASDELAASSRALENARQASADAERQAQAARQAETERRAAAEREAERQAAQREAEREAERQAAQREAEREAERQAAQRAAAAAAAAALVTNSAADAAADGSVSPAGSSADAAPAQPAADSASGDAGAPDSQSGRSATDTNASQDTTLLAAAAAARTTLDLDSGTAPAGASDSSAAAQAAVPPAAPERVGISALTRTRYESPKYPRSAMRRNITGSVDISFVVGRDGSVNSIEVLNSTPGSVFDQAAINAVKRWTFEPVIEDGQAVEKRSAVRMAFDLQ